MLKWYRVQRVTREWIDVRAHDGYEAGRDAEQSAGWRTEEPREDDITVEELEDTRDTFEEDV